MKLYNITCPTHGVLQIYGDSDTSCPKCEAVDSKTPAGIDVEKRHICPCDGTCLANIFELKDHLRAAVEHLEYLGIALAEQSLGNGERIAMWNSASTVSVVYEARKLLEAKP